MTARIDPPHAKFGSRRILIVDDHPLVRRGIAQTIAQEPDLEVCGEASDTTEALRLMHATFPDLLIIDLSLQGGHGIDLIEQVKLSGSRVKMLVVSMHDESLFAERVLRAGASGYISKQEPTGRILAGIRQVLAGEIALSPAMSRRILHSVVGGQTLAADPIQSLSNRELEVFEMIGQGLATKEIALKLHLSPKTIETHREKLKNKLNVENGNELNRRAVQWVLRRK